MLCACKQTKNAPYCDGSHFKVIYQDLVKSVKSVFKWTAFRMSTCHAIVQYFKQNKYIYCFSWLLARYDHVQIYLMCCQNYIFQYKSYELWSCNCWNIFESKTFRECYIYQRLKCKSRAESWTAPRVKFPTSFLNLGCLFLFVTEISHLFMKSVQNTSYLWSSSTECIFYGIKTSQNTPFKKTQSNLLRSFKLMERLLAGCLFGFLQTEWMHGRVDKL